MSVSLPLHREQEAQYERSIARFERRLKALRRNPMRAMLTTLGIVIGVGGRHRHDGDRRRLFGRHSEIHRQHGRQRPAGHARHGRQRRRQLRRRQRHDPDARGLRGDSPGVPRRPQRRPGRPRRTQVVYGNRNWVPSSMYGTTPAFLDIRDWTDLAEGELFTDRDVLNANKVCLLGQTLVRELFQGESPDRQGDPRQERVVPGRGRARPQGRQHDGHGPGRHPAGALDHHQVPRHGLDAGRTPTRAAAAAVPAVR